MDITGGSTTVVTDDPFIMFIEDIVADEELSNAAPNHVAIEVTIRDDVSLGEPDFRTPRTNVYVLGPAHPNPARVRK